MNFKKIFRDLKIKHINSNYSKILQKLSKKVKNNEKIKIVFINCEASKWAYQYIYEKFANDKRFEVEVLISVFDMLRSKKYAYLNIEKKAQENYDFFKKQGINVEYAYDFKKNKCIDLRQFSPDIIFYDEPQSVSKLQSPAVASKFALTMHCNYGSAITNGDNEKSKIYEELFTYFVDNEFIKKYLTDCGFSPKKIYVAGQPKIDAYLKPVNYENKLWKTDKKHIIIAHHFSFSENTELRFGTFDWNYQFFYDYAKNHPEYEFILKPHPSLKREIIKRGLMNQKEAENYFKNWNKLENANVYESGNYLDMFRTSDLLITDCNSFLFEYLPSKNPVIQLISSKTKGHNEFGKKIIEGYYKAHNIVEIEEYLEKLLSKNDDDLLKTRENIIKNVLKLTDIGTSGIIYNYVNNIINNKQNENLKGS